MKKLALFDMDGTLFYTTKANYEAYRQAIEEQGYKLTYEVYSKDCMGRQFYDFISNIIPNREDLYPIIHKRKKELYPNFLNQVRVNQHLLDIAKAIKKDYNLAIITTASKKNVSDILSEFKLNNFFDLIITGEDVNKNKPDPECYFKAIEHFKADIKDVVIFEDSLPGIEAAKKTNATIFIINNF